MQTKIQHHDFICTFSQSKTGWQTDTKQLCNVPTNANKVGFQELVVLLDVPHLLKLEYIRVPKIRVLMIRSTKLWGIGTENGLAFTQQKNIDIIIFSHDVLSQKVAFEPIYYKEYDNSVVILENNAQNQNDDFLRGIDTADCIQDVIVMFQPTDQDKQQLTNKNLIVVSRMQEYLDVLDNNLIFLLNVKIDSQIVNMIQAINPDLVRCIERNIPIKQFIQTHEATIQLKPSIKRSIQQIKYRNRLIYNTSIRMLQYYSESQRSRSIIDNILDAIEIVL